MVLVECSAHVARWPAGKRVALEERQHLGSALEEADAKVYEPGVLPIIAKRGKPHLPIEPWLVRFDKSRPSL